MADDQKLLRDEALRFSNALVRTKPMLEALAKLLAENATSPDEVISKVNAFIQNKSQNGIDDYKTDYDHVLEVQQTLQTYTLLYWNGFYATKLGKVGQKETTDGPTFVIAATLDAEAPVHIGLARTQIIEPTFASLVLSWEKSAVQNNAGRLIFNLVPDNAGRVVRTFAGTWTSDTGETQLLTGAIDPQEDKTPEKKEEEKYSLPPALQVIFPAITALGAIVAVVGGIVGMAWICKQWKEKNRERAEKEAAARDRPDDEEAQREAEDASREASDAEGSFGRGADNLRRRGPVLREISDDDYGEAVRSLRDSGSEEDFPPPARVREGVAATIAEQSSSGELRAAAAQQGRQVAPDPLLVDKEESEGEGEEALGAEVENGPLNIVEEV